LAKPSKDCEMRHWRFGNICTSQKVIEYSNSKDFKWESHLFNITSILYYSIMSTMGDSFSF
jgi:hypothetical protein